MRFSAYGQTFKASQIGKEFGYRTLLNTFSENKQAEKQNQYHSQEQSQGASIVGSILSGIGSMTGSDGYSGHIDYGESVAEEEERKRKRKKKRIYGRQQ